MIKNAKYLILFLISFVIIDGINLFLGRGLNSFGLVPRSVDHLFGILTAPWLHGNLGHLLTNITALCVFSVIVWQWGQKRFWFTTLFIIVSSGLFVWIFGRSAYHIGASGLVYGYFAFCLIGGWLSGRPLFLIMSVVVALLYGSMIWGVLPVQKGVSFEYHLSGFLVGLVAARLWAKRH